MLPRQFRDNAPSQLGSSYGMRTMPLFPGNIILLKEKGRMRESFPRQVDKKSRGPQGERGLEFSRRKKGQTFFPSLHSLGLYNNNVLCLRTVSVLNLLANSVILKCKLWEYVWWGLYNLLTFFWFTGEYITPLLTLARGHSFYPLLMPMSEAFSISFVL